MPDKSESRLQHVSYKAGSTRSVIVEATFSCCTLAAPGRAKPPTNGQGNHAAIPGYISWNP
jgi:hypothetical protein